MSRTILCLLLLLFSTTISSQGSNVQNENLYYEADVPPLFPGCDSTMPEEGIVNCVERRLSDTLLTFLSSTSSLEKELFESGAFVLAAFVINIDGSMSDIDLIEDPGDGLGDEVIRGLNHLKQHITWTPAYIDDKPVKFHMMMPVYFGSYVYNAYDVYSKEDEVDELPIFPGCDTSLPLKDLYACSQKTLLRTTFLNLIYPTEARENGRQGMTLTSFIINTDGSMSDFVLIEDPGSGLGEEAMRVVRKLSETYIWTPAKVDGKPVKYNFTLPIGFRLE